MVAAGVLVDARRAAELAPDDHRHVVEHAAHVEVLDQGAEALIELAAVVADQVEVLAVAVPAAVGQRHAANAGLDQPAGHQQMIVDGRSAVVLELVRLAVAVALADLVGSRAQVEGVEQLAGGRARRGPARSAASQPLSGAAGVEFAAQAVEAVQQPPAVAELVERDAVERQVGHAGAVRLEGSVGAGRGSRAGRESDQGMCCVGAARPTNGGTDGSTGPCSLATDRADAGPAAQRRIESCGQPVMHWTASWPPVAPTTERMTAHLSMRAAMRGKTSPIWMPGTLVAIGLNSPRISAGRVGLDVPHVLMRRAAAQEDVDDRLVRRGRSVPASASARNTSTRLTAPAPKPRAPI